MNNTRNTYEALKDKLTQQTAKRGNFRLNDLPHPYTLKNNQLAAKRIIENLCAGKRMLIIGDYDADGIFATIILMKFFRELGFGSMVDYKIPSRLKDGYGLNPSLIDYAKENGFGFCVTVDNGIAAVEAINHANELGFEVIITDHHTPPAVLPNTEIIVNPKCDPSFAFPHISGATVAWYLAYAIQLELNSNINMSNYLDLVAITIVSDVMPLVNINVPLLNYGISLIKKQKRSLYKMLWNDYTLPVLDSIAIAFNLVPMINAVGRIDDANKAVDIFLNDSDPQEAFRNFMWIKGLNEQRKQMSRDYLQQALDALDNIDVKDDKVIVVVSKDFHEGLVGIIAGKLAEKYHRPAYVLTYSKEKKIYKGSGRSSGKIHLYDLTNSASDCLLGFGGHAGAVGLSLAADQLQNFSRKVQDSAEVYDPRDFIDDSKIPMEVRLEEINQNLMDMIESFAPFGEQNPLPSFTSSARVSVAKELKDGLHFKCSVSSDHKSFTGLFFNVEKEKFLKSIEAQEVQLKFTLSKSYNVMLNDFSIELLCEIAD